MPTRLQFAARTDAGPRREENEDSFLVADIATGERLGPEPVRGELQSAVGVALAVLDGCGRFFRADTAVEIAAEAMRVQLIGASHPAALCAAMRAAADAIEPLAADPDRAAQVVATLGVIEEERLHLVHIGGTRAYLLRGGHLVQLTRDDTLANDAAELGYTKEHGDGELVMTRWLGRGPTEASAVIALELKAGDSLLLSTMGLHHVIDRATIERVLVSSADSGTACDALYQLAVSAGAVHNITIVVARPIGDSLPSPLPGEVFTPPHMARGGPLEKR